MAHGLPQERAGLTRDELITWQHHADNPNHEPWHFLLGPTLARKLDRFLIKHSITKQYYDEPSRRDELYTKTLLSLLPEAELHGRLNEIFSAETKQEEENAAKNLIESLDNAEKKYGEKT